MGGALVTGAGGFVGGHLVRALQLEGEEVTAVGHGAEVDVDLRWPELVDDLVARARPAVVYHLAATASLDAFRADPTGTQANIVHSAVNVARALLAHAPGARLVLVSDAAVYGRARGPIAADAPLRPADLYGAARASAERMVGLPAAGLDVVVARPYPHTGPGQRHGPLAAVARAAAEGSGIALAVAPDAEQDWLDVRDVVSAYRVLAARGKGGAAYTIATGRAHRLAALAARVAGEEPPNGAAHPPRVEVRWDSSARPPTPNGPGDATALRELGWEARHDLDAALVGLRAWYERGGGLDGGG